ncbi:GNAT family N-acetyltransferase [Deinococcus planocerae]|uniref:GNAT family N-acetyltransferase n=1 Tax=Deinococcus planocerae TaxID=1737569 RepID=UPI001FE4FAD7|nr:GNAT family N-acetyltransferase [Deinococcus planocerae]
MLDFRMDAPSPVETSPPLPPGVTLRPATPADTVRVAAFLTAAHPESPVAPEDLERQDAGRVEGEFHRRTLALAGDEIVGLAETGVPRMDGHPGWLEVTVRAVPERAGGPLAEALLTHAETAALGQGAHTLVSRVRENWWERPFLEARGYAEHDRMWPSTLDLRTLDFAGLARYGEGARAAGVRIRPLSELGDFDEAQQRRLYTLIAALLRDVPSTTPVSVWPFELWQRRAAGRVNPAGLFIAVAPEGEWVGLSELHLPIPTRPGTLHNGLTGVLPAWRGRGLASALKLAAARAALERGFTHSRTSNHSVNAPMLAVNARLGFVREGATVTLTREVSGS